MRTAVLDLVAIWSYNQDCWNNTTEKNTKREESIQCQKKWGGGRSRTLPPNAKERIQSDIQCCLKAPLQLKCLIHSLVCKCNSVEKHLKRKKGEHEREEIEIGNINVMNNREEEKEGAEEEFDKRLVFFLTCSDIVFNRIRLQKLSSKGALIWFFAVCARFTAIEFFQNGLHDHKSCSNQCCSKKNISDEIEKKPNSPRTDSQVHATNLRLLQTNNSLKLIDYECRRIKSTTRGDWRRLCWFENYSLGRFSNRQNQVQSSFACTVFSLSFEFHSCFAVVVSLFLFLFPGWSSGFWWIICKWQSAFQFVMFVSRPRLLWSLFSSHPVCFFKRPAATLHVCPHLVSIWNCLSRKQSHDWLVDGAFFFIHSNSILICLLLSCFLCFGCFVVLCSLLSDFWDTGLLSFFSEWLFSPACCRLYNQLSCLLSYLFCLRFAAGQERFASLHPSYYYRAHGAILVSEWVRRTICGLRFSRAWKTEKVFIAVSLLLLAHLISDLTFFLSSWLLPLCLFICCTLLCLLAPLSLSALFFERLVAVWEATYHQITRSFC